MSGRRSTSESTKQLKPKKKRSFLGILGNIFLFFLIISSIAAVALTGFVFVVIKSAPPVDMSDIHSKLENSSFIYDKDGNLIEKIHGSNYRSIVNLNSISPYIQNAFISIEDERFESHHGIDIKRIIGALFYDLRTMSRAQGASTINQQLAKNLFTSSEKSIKRKILDAYYAIQLDKNLSKNEILEAYLNTIYLGRNAYGVEAASEVYFSKHASDLNLAESAMIAGVTKSPLRYSPCKVEILDGTENLEDTQLVFYIKKNNFPTSTEQEKMSYKELLSLGRIDKSQYDQLQKDILAVRKATLNPEAVNRQQVILKKMKELGKITQTEYDEALSSEVKLNIGKKEDHGISSYFADLVKDQVTDDLIKIGGYSEEDAKNLVDHGGLRIYSSMDLKIQKTLEKEYENSSNFPGTFYDKNGNLQPQSSMVIMDHRNGQVVALVGGRMIGGKGLYNRAVNPRQPGSAIKPLAVYLPALANGMTAASIVDDAPIKDSKGNPWPRNVDRQYRGPSTLRELLKRSSNAGTVNAAIDITGSKNQSIELMGAFLKKLGISSFVTKHENPRLNDDNLAMTLGGMTKGISPLELTAAYAAIANKGVYIKPTFYTKVETSDGVTLLESSPKTRKIVSPQVAYIMTTMLEDVVNQGTGRSAKLSGIPAAGKTGTTSNKFDAWFAGYTPYYVGATWIGVDIPQKMPTGSKMTALLWKKIMQKIHQDLPNKNFKMPDGIIKVSICNQSGKIATSACNSTKSEYFVSGTQPKSHCSYSHGGGSTVETDENLDPDQVIDDLNQTNPDAADPNSTTTNTVPPTTNVPNTVKPNSKPNKDPVADAIQETFGN